MSNCLLTREGAFKRVKDCKVIPGVDISTQHRMVVMQYSISVRPKRRTTRRPKQIRWWKLKEEEKKEEFSSKI